MKQFTLVQGFLLLIAIFTLGQTVEDTQSVIQMSIDLDDLQQYYGVDKIEGRKPLVIQNNGVVPTNLNLTKFGEPVQFMTEEELFFYGKEAFLAFERFEISQTRADVEFQYKIEGLIIKLTFVKADENWTIKKQGYFERRVRKNWWQKHLIQQIVFPYFKVNGYLARMDR